MTDEGSGTVWVLVCALVLASAAALVVVRGAVALERHRVAGIADEAALAAASQEFPGRPAGCRAAARVAAAAGATLVSCRPAADQSVDVVVEAAARGMLAGASPLRVGARAGPASARPTS